MRIVSVRFVNYWKNYTFESDVPLEVGKMYKITASGAKYSAPVYVDEINIKKPAGIALKRIVAAEEVIEK